MPKPAPVPEPVPEPEPEPESRPEEPQPGPDSGPPTLEPRPGRFDVVALEQLVASASVDDARADELRAYLAALRGQADEHGLLPAALESVVHEVFGVLFAKHP